MKNDIYSMLNEAEININEYEREDFNDIEKKKLKDNFRKSINKNNTHKKKQIAAAAVLVLLVSAGGLFGTDAGAQVLAKFSENIERSFGIERDLEDYKTVVNKPVTQKGITIQLNEVILNQSSKELVISDSISSERALAEYETYDTEREIYINNKKAHFVSEDGMSERIDDYTSHSVLNYDLSSLKDMDLSGDLDIKIVYSEVMVNHEDSKKGKWVFEFKTNGDNLKMDTKEIKLDNEFTLGDGEKIILEKYTDNALGQKIYARCENAQKKISYSIMLKGTDDLGNAVEFYLSKGTRESKVFRYENIDGNLNENAKELKLTPYAVKMPEESGQMSNDYQKTGDEFIINLNK